MKNHFIVAAHGTAGDILPFIELGKYLLGTDHKVSFITNPIFENIVKHNGLRFIPFGTLAQYNDAINDIGMWDPKRGFSIFWAKTIKPNIHCIRLYVQSLDSQEKIVILSGPTLSTLAALAKAHRKNIKSVLVYLYPAIIRTHFGRKQFGDIGTLPKTTPKLVRKALYSLIDRLVLDKGTVADLNEARVPLGLEAIKHFLPHLQNSADLYVTLFPEWYSSTKPDYPKPLISTDFMFYASSPDVLRDDLREFLNSQKPSFLFTAGTENRSARKFFQIALDAVRKIAGRAVFLTKFRDQLPIDLPDSVIWQEYVPLDKILPSVSVIIHHGGVGTVAQACRAGVPQLIVPFAYDQFDNALIVRDLGIGSSIALRRLTSHKLASELLALQRSRIIKEMCIKVSSNFGSRADTNLILDRVVKAI